MLEEIETLLANKTANRGKLSELSSRFYTIIPHDFGRKVPPVIQDEETLRKKFDMLLVSDVIIDDVINIKGVTLTTGVRRY